MDEETETPERPVMPRNDLITEASSPKPKPKAEAGPDSALLGVSIRGWIAIIIVATVCIMSAFGTTVTEPLYSMSLIALGFYFGQKTPKTK